MAKKKNVIGVSEKQRQRICGSGVSEPRPRTLKAQLMLEIYRAIKDVS